MSLVTNSPEIVGAGGVVFDTHGRVLVLGHRNGTWVFPKGHLDPGETALTAALREVEEEAGLAAVRRGDAATTTRYTNNRGELRRITWFLMTTAASEPVLREETFPQGAFLAPAEARARLSYNDDKQLLDTMLAHFAETAPS